MKSPCGYHGLHAWSGGFLRPKYRDMKFRTNHVAPAQCTQLPQAFHHRFSFALVAKLILSVALWNGLNYIEKAVETRSSDVPR